MSKIYESRFDILFNESKNEVTLKKNESGKYGPENAQAVWDMVISRKKPLSKWDFYVNGFNQTLSREESAFNPAKAVAWLKAQGVETTVTVALGKWGKPLLRIDPTTKTVKQAKSDIQVW